MTGPSAFFPMYPADYRNKTRRLSLAEHGAYNLLIMEYWTEGGPIPDDDVLLARIVGCGIAEWLVVSPVVRKFFHPATIDATRVLMHERIEEELAKARGKYEAARVAGKRSAEARKAALERLEKQAKSSASNERSTDSPTDDQRRLQRTAQRNSNEHANRAATNSELRTQSTYKSSLRSESSELGLEVERGQSAPNPENPTQRSKNADEIGSDFKIWYAKFPRHEALARAEKAYRAARKSGASAAELLAGAERYARLRAGEDKRYTQLPASWLNGRCWLDELPAQAVGEPEPKSPEMLSATRRVYLRDWAAGKPWIANISGNGVWIDEYGIGPPPDDPRTLVTPEDLAAVPAAKERLEATKAETSTKVA